MSNALSVVLVLGGLIFFHELGHFLVARMLGIGVRTFSLGFGPRLLGFRRGNTDYQLSLVPLGGYVSLVGEGDDDELPTGFTQAESFASRPPLHRMLVVAAGPVFNLVLAWFIYWGLFWSGGQVYMLPEVGTVQAESPAAAADIRPGDRILSIGDRVIARWDEVAETIAASGGNAVTLRIGRGHETLEIPVTPAARTRKTVFGEEKKAWLIGVTASGQMDTIHLGPMESARAGLDQTWHMIVLTGQGVVKMIERVVPMESVGGPILIAQMVSKQAEEGLSSVLALTALISINLGLLNLLPIPILDGGHIVFLTMEMVIRRPVSIRLKEITMRFGLALLLALMVFATYNDIVRMIQ